MVKRHKTPSMAHSETEAKNVLVSMVNTFPLLRCVNEDLLTFEQIDHPYQTSMGGISIKGPRY